MTHRRATFWLWIVCFFFCIGLVGCSGGYRLGSIGGPAIQGIKTIYVPTVKNKTVIPGLQSMVTNEIIRAIDNDGTMQTSRNVDADAELDVTIVDFNRVILRPEILDPFTTAEYKLIITASVTLINRKLGRATIKGAQVSGSSYYFTQTNMPEAQRQDLPLVAEDLANRIVNLLTEGW
ncbi:hypothetical protein A7K73_06290 [Candidatus Methylacidiphilum fumarolicum]|uniref:Lipopolysaccharide-assembly n=2 Tax=Candidatus Methylacidiphilum fumarolicum TaxID=591154 RepID=I0JXH0_METFB|nr:LptE family protein [Candidatus Methylacidiphilum fumarolicum]TFE69264.1 hypothetical protein A7K73_06290 [Candidatus Methylacidiphilum fumarolicum]TFE76990.1 hypothetical protein A7D33_07205 [Candidatus Methylacidiphilum fumarolicum]CAI9086260.1 conserved protein of unknown function [Candidatus Methylacidiphilum fumarolicum]CCG91939.1 conserved hypothetical protein [Methylacidiphilum fumariolicum SolV]